jgi:hypothetical protein|tara:strand:+ start:31611 stop:32078 length:468 start_codon:yes stop_codon:yes gene_type:complete
MMIADAREKKCALQKMFEKFMMLAGGLNELTQGPDPDDPLTGGLAILPCAYELGGETEAQLVICYCTWDVDGELLTTTPLVGLLAQRHLDGLTPDHDRCSPMTELFYRKMLEHIKDVAPAGFRAFTPDFYNADTPLGNADRDFDEAAEIMYPSNA